MIRPSEWRWVITVALLIMAFTTVPYLVAASRANDAWIFSGFIFGVEDGNSYLAKMQLGAHGEWLFQISYAVEDHPKALFFPFHILLGKLTGWVVGIEDPLRLHNALIFTYHLSRIVFGFLLLLVTYCFLAELLPRVRQRRFAFLLTAIGGGLGWLLLLFRSPDQPLELYSPEAFSFLDLYGLPHLSASRAFMLIGLLCYLKALRSKWQWGLASGVSWLIMTLIQPFYMVIIFAVIALHVFVLAMMAFLNKDSRLRKIDLSITARRAFWIGVMAGAFGLPMTLYSFILFSSHPIYKIWSSQNYLPSPPIWVYLAAWGLFIFLGIFGLRSLYRRNFVAYILINVWIFVVPILLYVPYNLQRRFSEGIYIPIAALAIYGVTVVFSGRHRLSRLLQRYAPITLILLSLPMTLILWAGGILATLTPAQPIYQTNDQVAAYVFLAKTLPSRAIVVSSYQVGNALPAYGYLVSAIGHGPETPNLSSKMDEVRKFYSADVPAPFDASSVIVSPFENVDSTAWKNRTGLKKVFESGAYSVWQIIP